MATVGTYKRLNYYRQTADEVIAELHSHRHGLTNPEAARRFAQHGPNTIVRYKRDGIATTLLRQFKSLFVIILLVGAGLAWYLRDANTTIILLVIAALNAAIGFFQEHKAESLLRSLEKLLVPTTKVFRGAGLQVIDSRKLVVGDIVRLEAGDSVPADLRIIEEDELATNDFALTGESNPTRKFVHAISTQVPLASRHNLIFMGTTVATGNGIGVVVGIGMHTELGRIAGLAQVAHNDSSPLQHEMNNLARRLVIGTIFLGIILNIVALHANLGLQAALLFAIGIATAMIPNGLMAEVNITLAQTANRMAKARTLVKKLSAVETLGATTMILTDKTGTLTQNQMTVTEVLIGKSLYKLSGKGYEPNGEVRDKDNQPLAKKSLQKLALFFETAALASNAKVTPPDSDHQSWHLIGDPTEGALVTMALKAGTDIAQLESDHPEVKEFQFDSGRKLMSSVRHIGNKTYVYVKGAPEEVLARCDHLWDHGHSRKLTAADTKRLADYNDRHAKAARRNLALAYRVYNKKLKLSDLRMDEVEQKLTFLGIASMVDPVREEVPAAMRAAQQAHVKVSMVTGDYPATALAVAQQVDLGGAQAQPVTVLGEELAGLHDSQILDLMERGGTVFSRVSPEDKLRLVEIAKRSGNVVAVTGDGINDAPALKRADIGVAMGKDGTDIAKDAADIVLLDDSFHHLVGAIEQGRLTFKNIRKAARCALTDNAGELVIILISLAMNAWLHIPIAITAVQILAIDMIAQIFPITALGWDKPSSRKNLMHERPRARQDHILNWGSLREFTGFGLLSAVIAYLNFVWFFERQGLSPRFIDTTSELYMQATILTYVTLVLCQFINLLLVRTEPGEPFFTKYLWSNKKLLVAFGLSSACIITIVYNPWLQPYLHTHGLTIVDWLTAFAGAGIYLAIRLLVRGHPKHTRAAVVSLHHEVHGRHAAAQI